MHIQISIFTYIQIFCYSNIFTYSDYLFIDIYSFTYLFIFTYIHMHVYSIIQIFTYSDIFTGNTRLKKLREIERQELRLLVGTSLVRLSDISGLCDEITYTRLILPPVFNVIISCHDPTAQEYLVDCFIQVFPDEFHLTNLVLILDNLVLLDSSVDMDSIITRFIERLPASSSDIEKKNSPCQETLEHFHVFIFNYIQRHVVQPSSGTTIRQVMGLFSTVLTWTSSSFAQENPAMRMSMIQKVLRDCLAFSQRPDILGPSHVEHEMGFIMDALEGMCERCFESNVEQVMTWPEIRKVLDMMVPRSRRVRLAIQLVKTLVSRRSLEFKLTSNSEVDRLMHLIEPLIKDDLSSVSSESESRVSSPTLRHKVRRLEDHIQIVFIFTIG